MLGAILCALGLAGPVFALIEQPRTAGTTRSCWSRSSPVWCCSPAFIVQERRSPEPMLPLDLFSRRNFAVANLATLVIYAGLGAALFFLRCSSRRPPATARSRPASLAAADVIMFFLSGRFGALADRLGPRLFMSAGR